MHYVALSGKIHRKPSEKRALASATRKWLGEIALESMQDQEHLAAKQVYCSHNIAACQTLTGWITELCMHASTFAKKRTICSSYSLSHTKQRFSHQSLFQTVFCGAYTIHQKLNIFVHSACIYTFRTENKRRQDDTETISMDYYAEKV